MITLFAMGKNRKRYFEDSFNIKAFHRFEAFNKRYHHKSVYATNSIDEMKIWLDAMGLKLGRTIDRKRIVINGNSEMIGKNGTYREYELIEK